MTQAQYLANCVYCNIQIDVRKRGTFQRVTGWVERRDQGGANAIALPERMHEYACGVCIDLHRKGIGKGQGTLW